MCYDVTKCVMMSSPCQVDLGEVDLPPPGGTSTLVTLRSTFADSEEEVLKFQAVGAGKFQILETKYSTRGDIAPQVNASGSTKSIIIYILSFCCLFLFLFSGGVVLFGVFFRWLGGGLLRSILC